MEKSEERMENMTEVEVEGLSRYRVFVDADGEPRVWSVRYGRWIPFRAPYGRKTEHVSLSVDGFPRMRVVPKGMLKFIIRHPKTGRALLTAPPYARKPGKCFNKDGEFSQIERNKPYRSFGSLDSALESVLLLINIRESGSTWQLYDFAERNRHQAKWAVMAYEKQDTIERAWESAKERFVRNCLEMDVERIRPLFAQLCCSLKSECKDYRKKDTKARQGSGLVCVAMPGTD